LNPSTLPPFVQFSDLLGIEGVFTDVDDTLTKDGKLSALTFSTLWQLQEAGIQVVPVTGRSYGWAHMMLSQWPVNAVIAESGGVYLHREVSTMGARVAAVPDPLCTAAPLKVVFYDTPNRVAEDRQRLIAVCQELLSDYPMLSFASDNILRQVDVAIDYCEDIPRVPLAIVQEVIQVLREQGFQARNSTVHINAWHGHFDKGPMALRYLKEVRSLTTEQAQCRWAFIGDAPNDRSMFELFPKSIAVSNIQPFIDDMGKDRPQWLTHASHGEGFVEFAQLLLQARQFDKA
jgi:hydroxymethylpyrimidine pyrophosphatase-like HAD family hydrolase